MIVESGLLRWLGWPASCVQPVFFDDRRGASSLDARAAALDGGGRDAPAGVTARVLPDGYGRGGDVTTGEWLAVGVAQQCCWALSGSD